MGDAGPVHVAERLTGSAHSALRAEMTRKKYVLCLYITK